MQLSPAQIALLNSILQEWNRAEEDIKVAEQVCNDIVIPSIKELRYGGRRLVDALVRMTSGASDEEVLALFHDAEFDCHRARHDAIDAGTSKIAIDLDVMVSKLGYEVILAAYPQFPALFASLQEIREKIAQSRRNRESREAIYSVLEKGDFPSLVQSFMEMRKSEKIMKQMARRRRASEAWGILGTVLGIIGILLAWYFWKYPAASGP